MSKNKGFIPLVIMIIAGLALVGGSVYTFNTLKNKPENNPLNKQIEDNSSLGDTATTTIEEEGTNLNIKQDIENKDSSSLSEANKKTEVIKDKIVDEIEIIPVKNEEVLDASFVDDRKLIYDQVLKEISILYQGFDMIDEHVSKKNDIYDKNKENCEKKYDSDIAYINSQAESLKQQILESRTGFSTPTAQLKEIDEALKYDIETIENNKEVCLSKYSNGDSLKSKIGSYKKQIKELELSLTLDNAGLLLEKVRKISSLVLNAV